ncbi:MAG: hypothetical protein EXR59_02395 [Dehalococcoidia bacterium]|nr:hypothetical protein [Dehalococcoidia bacterium]
MAEEMDIREDGEGVFSEGSLRKEGKGVTAQSQQLKPVGEGVRMDNFSHRTYGAGVAGFDSNLRHAGEGTLESVNPSLRTHGAGVSGADSNLRSHGDGVSKSGQQLRSSGAGTKEEWESG